MLLLQSVPILEMMPGFGWERQLFVESQITSVMNHRNKPEFSFILPCFNNGFVVARLLPGAIAFFRSLKLCFEVLICDDGSKNIEGLESIIAYPECRLLRHEKNAGKGATVRLGLANAKGSYHLYFDGDLPFDYETIELAIKLLRSGKHDVIFGDRAHVDSIYFKNCSKMRNLMSRVLGYLNQLILNKSFPDTQCGLKGFLPNATNEILLRSKIDRFGFDLEVVVIAHELSLRIEWMPVTLRKHEKSSIRTFRDGFNTLRELLTVRRNSLSNLYSKPFTDQIRAKASEVGEVAQKEAS